MFENVDGRTDDGRTDGRRTDGRTPDAGVTGILIAHLGAFGSGELKIKVSQQYWSGCPENHKAAKPAFTVKPSSTRQRNTIYTPIPTLAPSPTN